jgi:hypothetical protein
MHRMVIFALVVLWPVTSFACSSDKECNSGSTCFKASASVPGICVEGIAPSNVTNQEAAPDPNGTNGKSCSFDTDCGVGSRCLKSYSTDGVCMVGR